MSKIAGRDVILYIVTNASPETLEAIGCSRTCTLTTNAVTAGVSTIGSGIYSEFKALSINWTVSVDGLATFGDNMTIKTLRDYQLTLQPLFIMFKESTADTEQEYFGYAIITSITSTGNYNDVETYSVQMQGTGSIGNLYGNYPGNFHTAAVHSDTPGAGQTTIDLAWTAAYPTPDSYTIRVVNDTTSTTTFITGITGTTQSIVLISADSYSFNIKSIYFGGSAESDYSPTVSFN